MDKKLLAMAALALAASPAKADVIGPARGKGVHRVAPGTEAARKMVGAKGAVKVGSVVPQNTDAINEHNARVEASRQARLEKRRQRRGEV